MVVDPFGLIGQVIEGQFRVDRVVGEGGFSVVYRGHHLGLDEPVAIKVLKLQPSVDAEVFRSFQDRFRDESRIAYRLSRGNLDIVRSITAGTVQAPAMGTLVPYMVLEWLEGRSLGADFRERRKHGLTGRTMEEVLALFDPAVMAIAYAHAQGVVHRDLKPGNLFLAQTAHGPRMKVLDFGLAKIVDPTDEGIGIVPSAKTVGQHTICSPSYGAPEQFETKVGKIGPWTDVYSLGLVLLEALRDKKVRTGEGIAMCAIEALDPNRQPSPHSLGIKLRPQVEVVLARAVALDPKTRPEDAGVMWGLIKNAMRRTQSAAPAAGAAAHELATMVAVPPAPNGPNVHDEPTAHAPRGMMDLSATAERDAPLPRAAFKSEPPPMDLGGTLVMEGAPKRPGAISSAPRVAAGVPVPAGTVNIGPSPAAFVQPPVSIAPPSNPASQPTTMAVKRKKSRGGMTFLVVLLVLGVLGGGGWAAYRYVLLPRGITLPVHL